ncbi:MAG: helix-turn-helix domain-containing protein [Deltaproteobacteria bacterium]|nr:helix-turn-helix domain-containing protein [Deltaproteobacteria bacterium]
MEKICLARRRWEGNKVEDRELAPPVALPAPSEPGITIEPGEVINSLVKSLIAIGNKDYGESRATVKKFDLEVRYESLSPIKVAVYVTPAQPQTDKEWLTVEETARSLKVSTATIYKELLAGKLVGLKIGRQWRVFRPGLDGEAWEGLI